MDNGVQNSKYVDNNFDTIWSILKLQLQSVIVHERISSDSLLSLEFPH